VNVMLNVAAAARTSSAVSGLEALSGFHSKATRERAGTAALNSCSRLGCTSGPSGVLLVMLPPGWGADALVRPARRGPAFSGIGLAAANWHVPFPR